MRNYELGIRNYELRVRRAALWSLMLVGWVALLALAGCGGAADTTQPPETLYGQDVCDECDMIISEEKYAAAYWTEELSLIHISEPTRPY